jgi:hypothetical protein
MRMSLPRVPERGFFGSQDLGSSRVSWESGFGIVAQRERAICAMCGVQFTECRVYYNIRVCYRVYSIIAQDLGFPA